MWVGAGWSNQGIFEALTRLCHGRLFLDRLFVGTLSDVRWQVGRPTPQNFTVVFDTGQTCGWKRGIWWNDLEKMFRFCQSQL